MYYKGPSNRDDRLRQFTLLLTLLCAWEAEADDVERQSKTSHGKMRDKCVSNSDFSEGPDSLHYPTFSEMPETQYLMVSRDPAFSQHCLKPFEF